MTMTPIQPPPTSSLLDDLRAIQEIPPPAERRRIRTDAHLSLAQVGSAVGVSGNRVWQWEKRVPRLPITAASARYARLLVDLRQISTQVETPQK